MKHRLLGREEVVDLARTFRLGAKAQELIHTQVEPTAVEQLRSVVSAGNDARELLIRHNLRLVASIAKRQNVDGLTFDDHFQNGCLGLLRAVEKFDPEAGYQFSTYATWWIRQSIDRGIMNTARLIRIPVHVVNELRRLERKRFDQLFQKGWVSDDEVLESTEFTLERIDILRRLLPGPLSLDAVIGVGLSTLGDLLPAKPDPTTFEDAEIVQNVLGHLTERQQEILRLRFGIDSDRERTLEEVGNEFGVTRERIRQIEAKALAAMKSELVRTGVFESRETGGETPDPPSGPTTVSTKHRRGQDPSTDVPPWRGTIDHAESILTQASPRLRTALDELVKAGGTLAEATLLDRLGLTNPTALRRIIQELDVLCSDSGIDTPLSERCEAVSLSNEFSRAWRQDSRIGW